MAESKRRRVDNAEEDRPPTARERAQLELARITVIVNRAVVELDVAGALPAGTLLRSLSLMQSDLSVALTLLERVRVALEVEL
jgi:hypothetical protein